MVGNCQGWSEVVGSGRKCPKMVGNGQNRGEIPKGKHFAKSNFEKIRVKVFETILVLEGLFCDVLIKIWYQKEA